MAATTFDTHRFIRKLQDAGIDEKQAEAFADAMRDAQDGADLATKKDLAVSDIALRKDLAEMKYDLLKWIIGLALAQFALLVSVLLKLPH